jgi:hypothetical protein
MFGNHPPCFFCECFICGKDGFLRFTESGDFNIILCDDHFVSTSEQYVSVHHNNGTMIVSLIDLNWGGTKYLDLMLFVQLMINQDVIIGDNL